MFCAPVLENHRHATHRSGFRNSLSALSISERQFLANPPLETLAAAGLPFLQANVRLT